MLNNIFSSSHNENSTVYQKNIKIDIALYLILCLIGWASIFSIEQKETDTFFRTLFNGHTNYSKQLIWIIISLGIGGIIISINSKFYALISYLVYAIGITLMIATIFVGTNMRGSKSWLSIGGVVNFQVAQLMFLCTLFALSKYLSHYDISSKNIKIKLISLSIILLPFFLTLYQSETGLALVYISLILVLYREGVSILYVLTPVYFVFLLISHFLIKPLIFDTIIVFAFATLLYYFKKTLYREKFFVIAIVLFMGLTIFLHNIAIGFVLHKALAPYQIKRIQNAFKPEQKQEEQVFEFEKKKRADNYNVEQSMIAIGSGGFLGKGFLKNTQTRLNFVPEQSTDFIICSFAESFGFLGILVILLTYLFLLLRILSIAEKQRSVFSRCYAYGFISIILFHLIINLGMTVGLLPVIGIPLPFVSYGGGAMLTFSAMYFILIRLDIDRQVVIK